MTSNFKYCSTLVKACLSRLGHATTELPGSVVAAAVAAASVE